MKLRTALLAPVGLAIVCNALPANHLGFIEDTGNQTIVHSPLLLKRALKENKCSGPGAGWVTQALADAPVALNRMIARSKDLITFLSTNSMQKPSDSLVLSTLHTFQAIYGQVWFGSRPDDNIDGAEKVQEQIDTAQKLVAALSSTVGPPIWEFYCNDDYLMDKDPFGEELLQYQYWDDRDAARGGQEVQDFSHLKGSCRDNTLGLTAFLDVFVNAQTETITFCQNSLFTGESLSGVRQTTYASQARNLDDIKKRVLGFSLLHELSHSLLVLGADRYIDTPYSEGINGAAYGWASVIDIREDEDVDASINADSFAFYVTGTTGRRERQNLCDGYGLSGAGIIRAIG